jgi:hypothetical protein
MTKWFLVMLVVGSLAASMNAFAGAGCCGCKGKKADKPACAPEQPAEKPAAEVKA